MTEFSYLTSEEVPQVHARVLTEHGGTAGIRSRELLESAIAAPQASFGGNPIMTEPIEIAAAYLFYLCRNHPFIDGNKRVALASCLVFLRMHGLSTRSDSKQWEALTLDVAASRLDRDETTARLRALVG
ncbi:MAG: type II toxin-antitoxin system death-on-curing family toxin [Chthoniobacterales bacterium]